jgi:hypothetical protein
VAAADETVRDALIREMTAALQPYVNDEGLAFPIEGQIGLAHP